MKNIEQRAAFDDYELEDNYDFSNGVRGRFYKPKKIRTTLQLDKDILLTSQRKAY
jgi:hypothetical protein